MSEQKKPRDLSIDKFPAMRIYKDAVMISGHFCLDLPRLKRMRAYINKAIKYLEAK